MKNNEFQDKFNRLFEENMQNKIDESKNDWFKDENPQYNISNSNNSKANIGAKFNELKEQNKIVKDRRCVQVNYVTFPTDWKVNS